VADRQKGVVLLAPPHWMSYYPGAPTATAGDREAATAATSDREASTPAAGGGARDNLMPL